MSKIALVINSLGANRAGALALLRREFGIGFSQAQQAVGTGRPLLERRLFDRADPEFAPRLAIALETMANLGAAATAYELTNSQSYTPGVRYFELTPTRLRNIIADREQSMVEQAQLADLRGETSE